MENMMVSTSQHTSGTTARFPLDYLKKITNNFSKDQIIGSGAYGVVYKGVLDSGQKIAVKKLKNMSQDFDGEKQFRNECTNLKRVQHQNIVRLVGYCYETCRQLEEYGGKYVFAEVNERALCFKYMEGGSLENYVSDKPCTLGWDICYKIIKGVCEGLNHLHNGYKYIISHLDLKPANILLDEDMIPKIGDFGLSRLLSSTKTCTTTTRLGTLGFTPPEYIDNQEISPKYDVFSLGAVIIYIMAGRKQYNDHFDNPSKIIELVSGHWEKRLDATIWVHASQEVNTCIKIALRCVKSDRHERPIISKIVEDLNTIDIAKLSLTYEATNLQSGEASNNNQCTKSVSMGVHDNDTEFDPMEGIYHECAVSKEVGRNDWSMHDPMDYVHDSNESIMRDQASRVIGLHGSRAILEPRDVTQASDVDIDGHLRMNSSIRAKGNLRTPGLRVVFSPRKQKYLVVRWSKR